MKIEVCLHVTLYIHSLVWIYRCFTGASRNLYKNIHRNVPIDKYLLDLKISRN